MKKKKENIELNILLKGAFCIEKNQQKKRQMKSNTGFENMNDFAIPAFPFLPAKHF